MNASHDAYPQVFPRHESRHPFTSRTSCSECCQPIPNIYIYYLSITYLYAFTWLCTASLALTDGIHLDIHFYACIIPVAWYYTVTACSRDYLDTSLDQVSLDFSLWI